MVAAAEDVGNHNAKANTAVDAVHIIITLNLKSVGLDKGGTVRFYRREGQE
jgi:hypothetical protein